MRRARVPALRASAVALLALALPCASASAYPRATRPPLARRHGAIRRVGLAQVCPLYGPYGTTDEPGACWRPYGTASPFNQPLDPNPPVAPNSDAVVRRLLHLGAAEAINVPAHARDRDDWGHPLYFAHPFDPEYRIHCTHNVDWGTCAVEGATVRIPAAARPATGSDHHLAVIDQSTGWEYDLWLVQSKPPLGGNARRRVRRSHADRRDRAAGQRDGGPLRARGRDHPRARAGSRHDQPCAVHDGAM